MNERKKNENRPGYRKPQWNAKKQPLERTYYDNADMIKLFKISKRTLQRWRDEGTIPFKKVRGKIFYVAAEVDDFMRGDSN